MCRAVGGASAGRQEKLVQGDERRLCRAVGGACAGAEYPRVNTEMVW